MWRLALPMALCACSLEPLALPLPEDGGTPPPGAVDVSTSDSLLSREESWARLPAAPASLEGCRAYWSGAELFFWSAAPSCVAQRFAEDGWAPMQTEGAPSASSYWAGSALGRLVVYGYDGMDHVVAVYDPERDVWSQGAPLLLGKAPQAVQAISADDKLLLWGGYDAASSEPLHMSLRFSKYDPEADAWQLMSTEQMPPPRHAHGAVWDSHHMFVIGGYDYTGQLLADGGVYDEGSDAWEPVRADGAPSARLSPAVAWTGYFYVVFGGTVDGVDFLGDGGVYCPEPCWAWQPMSPPDDFAPRHPKALFTGEHVVVLQTTDAPLSLMRYWLAGDGHGDRWERIHRPAALAELVVSDVAWDWSRHRALIAGTRCDACAHELWAYYPPFAVDPDDGHPGDNLAGNQTHR